MGSKTFEGVWFTSYSHDHLPPHVHGTFGETTLILDLYPVRQSSRPRSAKPANAPRNQIKRILEVAQLHERDLEMLWEVTHGK